MDLYNAIKKTPVPYAPWLKDVKLESDNDRLERKKKQCENCFYSMRIAGSSPGQAICGYMLLTGKMRGCSPINCGKFMPGSSRHRRGPDNAIRRAEQKIDEMITDIYLEDTL